MLSIQEVGTAILNHSPDKFYVFLGTEYGVKCKYIDVIAECYDGRILEASSVAQVIQIMRTRHLIPLEPTLYVIRYDDEFVASLDQKKVDLIDSLNIIGTIVCIYEDHKVYSKFEKWLPHHSVEITQVDKKYIEKYLRNDFPKLNDRFIKIAVDACVNYGHGRSICAALSSVEPDSIYTQSDAQLTKLFGVTSSSTPDEFKVGIAAKNFPYLINLLDNYEGDCAGLLYDLLSAMLELEKLKCTKYGDSPLKPYASRWTIPNIYNMFSHIYQKLIESRSTSSADMYSVLVYLFALTTYAEIPAVEVLQ